MSGPTRTLMIPGKEPEERRNEAVSRPGSLVDVAPADLPKICPVCETRYPVEFNVCPRDATQLDDAPDDEDDMVGSILAQTYTLVRLVGEGGMGRVYEAKHVRIPGKRFAIKLLHPEYARHGEVLSRFQREAEAAASIESLYVADVYDVHKTADGRPFIVAEFLDGRELAEYLADKGRLGIAQSVRIVRQVCRALMAAHDKGIVHRDMKPENVFLTGAMESPIAKVIDFGISKIKDAGGTTLTKTGMIMGTPAYMAPEQARGEKVDHRADVYAVGAILYNVLTGRRPFDKNDPTATITAVLLEDPERPCALNPEIPQALELVIQKAMAKNPDDRYQTMAELERDLEPFDPSDHPALPGMLVIPNGAGRARLASAVSSSDLSNVGTLSARMPSASRGSRLGLSREAREVEISRPVITLMLGLAGVGVLAGLLTLVGAVIRIFRGMGPGVNVTGSESLLLVSLLVLALVTPCLFAVLYIRRAIWNNTAKTVELAQSMRRTVTAGFVAYGVAWISVHFLETLVLRTPTSIAWPVWDILVTASSAAAAGAAFMTRRKRA